MIDKIKTNQSLSCFHVNDPEQSEGFLWKKKEIGLHGSRDISKLPIGFKQTVFKILDFSSKIKAQVL